MITPKMMWLRVVLISCLVLVQIGFTQVDVKQQNTDLRVEFNMPDNAVIGSTPERKAAYDALTEQQKKEIVNLVGPYLAEALINTKESYEKNERKSVVNPPSMISFIDWSGTPQRIPTKNSLPQGAIYDSFKNSNQIVDESFYSMNLESDLSNTTNIRSVPFGINMPPNTPVDFSEKLADYFTPYYHVSYGESDQFATFQNNENSILIAQRYGQYPLSYYRVHPMGFAMQNGTPYGFFKIDYLTLWDNDSGLASNPWGFLNLFMDYFYYYNPALAYTIVGVVGGLGGHTFDPERSAVLVGAPIWANNTYNPNPSAYYVFDAYAASHEGTQSDHSTYSYPTTPIQGHIELFLALNKHGTYFGNPNGLPLAPAWIIDNCYIMAQMLYLQGTIDFSTYNYLMYHFDVTFFNAITERFYFGGNQGYALPRINVGEPVTGQILNNCGFIKVSDVYNKLMTALWTGFSSSTPDKCYCN